MKDIQDLIKDAYKARNTETFRDLLKAHPEFWVDADGNDRWLGRAAQDCWLEGIQVLVQDIGLDINLSENIGEGTCFHSPEGPIDLASHYGCVQIVKWLLENGAKINFDYDGEERCMPLYSSLQSRNLEIVKLLVEHGANIHFLFNGYNCTTAADIRGLYDIRDYLMSKGGVDLRDEAPPDFSALAPKVEGNFRGEYDLPARVFQTFDEFDRPVDLRSVKSVKNQRHAIFTTGLANRTLARGRQRHFATELMMRVPCDWNVDDLPEFGQWALSELIRLARQVDENRRWIEHPIWPASPSPFPFKYWLVGWANFDVSLPGHRVIRMNKMIPLFPDELATFAHVEEKSEFDSTSSYLDDEMFDLDRQPIHPK